MIISTFIHEHREAIYVFVFLMLIFLLWFIAKNKRQVLQSLSIEDNEVENLKEKVKTLENYAKDLENKVKAMEALISTLIDRITEVNARQLEPLKKEFNALRPQIQRLARPVLLVFGDSELGEQDRNALRRAGVSFFRLKYGSLDDLRSELHRRRSEKSLYDIVHISAHGSRDNILINTDVVDGIELSNVLSGVRGIFLATCSNQDIADKLLGIVNYVVVVHEDIDTRLAANFVYEFYCRYKVDLDIDAAFSGALSVMPEISEFVDLRIGGSHEI